jgi:hypothetical protein
MIRSFASRSTLTDQGEYAPTHVRWRREVRGQAQPSERRDVNDDRRLEGRTPLTSASQGGPPTPGYSAPGKQKTEKAKT